MHRLLLFTAFLLGAPLLGAPLLGCGGGASPDGGLPEPDASVDAGSRSDAGVDAGPDAGAPGPTRILLFIADDFGVDSALPYADPDGDGVADDGRTYAPVPNLSRLCHEGVRFTRAYATPVCSPTRASILTGRHSFRTGIGWVAEGEISIGADEQTLPRVLDGSGLGFAHANIGKWHLGTAPEIGRRDAPNTMGWGHFAGVLQGGLPSYTSWMRTVDGATATETGYATTVNVDDAIAWLDGLEADRSWLLWVAFNAPHTPFHLPPAGLHSDDSLLGTDADIDARPADYFRAAVEAMDSEIGRLLGWLDERGQGDVQVFFLGDNGTPSQAVEAPYRGARSKGTLYENGIHVPLCAWGSRVREPGRVSDDLAQSADLFSTVLDLAGAPPPPGVELDSLSLLPILEGEPGSRETVFVEAFGAPMAGDDGRTAIGPRYKLLVFSEDGREELYDLESDPRERTNLLTAGPLTSEAEAAYLQLSAFLVATPPPP